MNEDRNRMGTVRLVYQPNNQTIHLGPNDDSSIPLKDNYEVLASVAAYFTIP